MGLLDAIHARSVYGRRIEVLARHLAELLPRNLTVLDVGCGDGRLDQVVMGHRPDLVIEGIDVLLRPTTFVPVKLFDGAVIPHPDKSFDAVVFVDVLHHTPDPAVLLREAARVARRCVVIKDHTMDGLLSGPMLRFMDRVGNERHGVVLPYNYWSSARWSSAFAEVGLTVSEDRRRLGIYPRPADWVFGDGLHRLTRLEVGGPARG
jgi:SAM-dependent methyltransferase